jgi:hypothetical protein
MQKYERGGLNVPSTNLAHIDLTFSPTHVDRRDAVRRWYGPVVAQQCLEGTTDRGSALGFLGSTLGFLGHGRRHRAHLLLLLRAMAVSRGGGSTAPLLHVSTALLRCE